MSKALQNVPIFRDLKDRKLQMLETIVLSKNVGLHSLKVVLVLIIGWELLGVMDLLIVVPVAASADIIG